MVHTFFQAIVRSIFFSSIEPLKSHSIYKLDSNCKYQPQNLLFPYLLLRLFITEAKVSILALAETIYPHFLPRQRSSLLPKSDFLAKISSERQECQISTSSSISSFFHFVSFFHMF
eukprot:TRINITY_DN4331_c0_g1_i2.p1 TRINITY_DN4331_c0_g1~~TRINITY_DN4331_c0_g1_i2.p1  ORF type:complete len:116 (+),score=1.34 TRINITY_DN4331_c0_g1_i2:420-767(+)